MATKDRDKALATWCWRLGLLWLICDRNCRVALAFVWCSCEEPNGSLGQLLISGMDLNEPAVDEVVFRHSEASPTIPSVMESAFSRANAGVVGSHPGAGALEHGSFAPPSSGRGSGKLESESVGIVSVFERSASNGDGNVVTTQFHDGQADHGVALGGAAVPSPICMPFHHPTSSVPISGPQSSPYQQSPPGQFSQPAFAPPESVHSVVTPTPVSTDSLSGVQISGSDRLAFLQTPSDTVAAPTPVNGQFYVMLPGCGQELASGQQPIAPRPTEGIIAASTPAFDSTPFLRPPRDDRRRATHNEVERRRRDKINSWITRMQQLLPGEHMRHGGGGSGQGSKAGIATSKGAVLAKAVDYIEELQRAQAQLIKTIKRQEEDVKQADKLRHEHEEMARMNAILRTELLRRGVDTVEGINLNGHGISNVTVSAPSNPFLAPLSPPLSGMNTSGRGAVEELKVSRSEISPTNAYVTPFMPIVPVPLSGSNLNR